jgi:hypothetical protein
MKVRLLDPDSDVSLEPRTPPRLADMVEDDLELRTLYKVMANGDQFLYDVANKVIPLGLTDPVVIEYRQDVLSDCMANQPVVQTDVRHRRRRRRGTKEGVLGRNALPRPQSHRA